MISIMMLLSGMQEETCLGVAVLLLHESFSAPS